MSLNEELFPTTHEPERGPGRGSSEDDRETRHAPAADPGSGSGIPRRKRAGRPATTNPRRLLRVRGENRATVRLRPAGEGRQGPAAPLPGQGGRLVTGPNHTPVAATPDHGRDRRPPRHPAPTVPAPLLQRRHRAAGRARRAPRHAVRSGHAQALRPRFPSVRRPPLSNAWPASPTAICTTCGTRQAINGAAERRRCRRARCRSRSGNAAARSRSDNLAGCGSIPSIKATWTVSRASTT